MGVLELMQAAKPYDGAFSRDGAHAHGVSAKVLRRLLKAGDIEQTRGAFRFSAVPHTSLTPIRSALVAAGDQAVASHSSALFVLGLTKSPAGSPEITLPHTVRPDLVDVRVHRTRGLADVDTTESQGIRTTSGPRTMADVAGRYGRNDRLDLLDDAVCSRVVSRSGMYRRAVELRAGRKGVSTLVEATHPDADGKFWSALERRFGEGVCATDLPRPLFNSPVVFDGERLVVDVYWPDHGLVVELQGLRFHSRPNAKLRDDVRRNMLTHLKLRLLVFGWRDVTENFETAVIPQLRLALL